MTRHDSILEEINYRNDRRVIAGQGRKWWEDLDERHMTATVRVPIRDEDRHEGYPPEWDDADEEVLETPIEWGVCPTCEGRGQHVKPSIDAGGITGAEFVEDPEFFADYAAGLYDVKCYQCNGRRVVPVPTSERVRRYLEEQARDEAEFRAMQLAELRMGA